MDELNSERIMRDIQSYIDSGASYMDALIEYSNREDIEIELLGEIIRKSPILKSKIYDEAESLKMVEKITRLPV
jgi:predicted aldo/keto reductase-like oxidoreductase